MTSSDYTSPVIESADVQAASENSYDIAIIGAGILGSILSSSLAKSGRKVLLIERDLSEPDRIVGELLQPGGCLAVQQLGLDSALEGIDAVPVDGYQVFWGDKRVGIPYPEESKPMAWSNVSDEKGTAGPPRKQQGRSFHHGRFVQGLRRQAKQTAGVTLIEATVNDLIENQLNDVIGLTATGKISQQQSNFYAKLTIVADGCMSKFRRQLLPSHVTPIVRSHFVGLVLEDADLPAPNHGHVILKQQTSDSPTSAEEASIGPVLVYQLSSGDTRMLIDVRGTKAPRMKELTPFLKTHVTQLLPHPIRSSFHRALEKSESGSAEHRLRSMPNSFLPAYPQGRQRKGVFLAGDSLNMRHPLTGGGMTVAANDAVILTRLLGAGKQVGVVEPDARGVVELSDWLELSERLEEWHWERKRLSTCLNVLAMALYSLFAAEDPNLYALKFGCFKYFELGGDCVQGPVSLLSALSPSPIRLFYHFFRVAFYSMYLIFATPIYTEEYPKGRAPEIWQYPQLTVQAMKVFWTACVVLLPVLWSETQM